MAYLHNFLCHFEYTHISRIRFLCVFYFTRIATTSQYILHHCTRWSWCWRCWWWWRCLYMQLLPKYNLENTKRLTINFHSNMSNMLKTTEPHSSLTQKQILTMWKWPFKSCILFTIPMYAHSSAEIAKITWRHHMKSDHISLHCKIATQQLFSCSVVCKLNRTQNISSIFNEFKLIYCSGCTRQRCNDALMTRWRLSELAPCHTIYLFVLNAIGPNVQHDT